MMMLCYLSLFLLLFLVDVCLHYHQCYVNTGCPRHVAVMLYLDWNSFLLSVAPNLLLSINITQYCSSTVVYTYKCYLSAVHNVTKLYCTQCYQAADRLSACSREPVLQNLPILVHRVLAWVCAGRHGLYSQLYNTAGCTKSIWCLSKSTCCCFAVCRNSRSVTGSGWGVANTEYAGCGKSGIYRVQ